MDVVELTVSFDLTLPSQRWTRSFWFYYYALTKTFLYQFVFCFFCLFSATCIKICLKGSLHRTDKICKSNVPIEKKKKKTLHVPSKIPAFISKAFQTII